MSKVQTRDLIDFWDIAYYEHKSSLSDCYSMFFSKLDIEIQLREKEYNHRYI